MDLHIRKRPTRRTCKSERDKHEGFKWKPWTVTGRREISNNCNTLQRTCNTLATHVQHTCNALATHLQHACNTVTHTCEGETCHTTATLCHTLQHAATRCNTLQHTTKTARVPLTVMGRSDISYNCNTLQHTATHCNTVKTLHGCP